MLVVAPKLGVAVPDPALEPLLKIDVGCVPPVFAVPKRFDPAVAPPPKRDVAGFDVAVDDWPKIEVVAVGAPLVLKRLPEPL